MQFPFPPSVQSHRLPPFPKFGAKADKRGGNRADASTEVIPQTDSVQLSEATTDTRLLNSLAQLSPNTAEMLEQARHRAGRTGAQETSIGHLMLSFVDTLKGSPRRSAGGRNTKQRDDRRFAMALTKAFAPNEGYTPQKLADVLEPVVTQRWGRKESISGFPEVGPPPAPPLQPELRNMIRQVLKGSHHGGNLAGAMADALKEQAGLDPFFVRDPNPLKSLNGLPPLEDPWVMADAEDSSTVSTAAQDTELMDQVAEKAPVVAKWFKPTHYRPGDKVEFMPLPQAIAKGMEASLRQATVQSKKKGANPKGSVKSAVEKPSTAFEAFIPGASEGKLDRSQYATVLHNAQQKLGALAGPQGEDALVTASMQSGALLSRFVQDPERKDFSPRGFMDFLRNLDAAELSEPESLRGVQRVLREIPEEVDAQKANLQDQFARECPALMKYGQSLVKRAKSGQLPEALMRLETTERMLTIMSSGGVKTNILLNAPSGAGKTYAVMGLAKRIVAHDVPPPFQGAQVLQLDLPALQALQAESGYKGEFERKCKEMFTPLNQYLSQHPQQKVIVFLDDMHRLYQEGSSPILMNMMEASGILEKKNLTLIGTTTPDDWRETSLASDSAVLRRFHPIPLPGFTSEEKLAILGRKASQLEKRSGVEIPPEILEKAMRQASAKWPENSLSQAIEVLNLAASISKGVPLDMAVLKDQLQRKELWLQTLSEKKTMKGRFQRQLEQDRQEAESLRTEIERHSGNWKADKPEKQGIEVVKEKHLRQALAILTGEKIDNLSRDERMKLRNAKEIMARHIVGQPEALAAIDEGLREIAIRHKTGAIRNRPIVSMLLPGPTGVGKTEAAKVISKEFMKGNFIRLDMSDFMEKHSTSLLTGASPGYIGYENGGLVDQIQKKPQSVVVFDEIEKAHPDVFNLLLQILEEGELRNNRGEPVSFRDAVIVLTSNLNQQELTDTILRHRQGKGSEDPQLTASRLEQEVRQLLTANPKTGRAGFRPELLGRIDYVIPFSPLNGNHVSRILDIRLKEMNDEDYLKEQNLQIVLSDAARQRLVTLTSAGSASGEKEGALQRGARDVRANFERYVYKRVMNDLAMEPELDELENAIITVDYDAKKQAFYLKTTPKPDFGAVAGHNGKTVAFA